MIMGSGNTKTKIAALLTGASIAVVSGSSAWAQDAPLEEEVTRNEDVIVVTARFREETVQDIGGSISALDSAAFEREGILDFEAVSYTHLTLPTILLV